MSEIDNYLQKTIFTPAVVAYGLKDDRILLIRRKATSLGRGLIAGFGGKVGDLVGLSDETPEEAINREAQEEIGIQITNKIHMGRVRFIFTHKQPDSKWNQEVDIFAVTQWTGAPQATESANPVWFALEQLPWDQMWPDNKIWYPRVLNDHRVNITFLYSDDKNIQEYRTEK